MKQTNNTEFTEGREQWSPSSLETEFATENLPALGNESWERSYQWKRIREMWKLQSLAVTKISWKAIVQQKYHPMPQGAPCWVRFPNWMENHTSRLPGLIASGNSGKATSFCQQNSHKTQLWAVCHQPGQLVGGKTNPRCVPHNSGQWFFCTIFYCPFVS